MQPRFAKFVILFAVMAVLLRAFIPSGYMPSIDAPFKMTICSLEGNKTITVTSDQNPFAPKHESSPAKHCDFNLTKVVSFDGAIAPFLFILALSGFVFYLALTTQIRVQRNRYVLPPSHAPPVSIQE